MNTPLNDLTHLLTSAASAGKDFVDKAVLADAQAKDEVVRPILGDLQADRPRGGRQVGRGHCGAIPAKRSDRHPPLWLSQAGVQRDNRAA